MKNKWKVAKAVLVTMLTLTVGTPLHAYATGTPVVTQVPSSVTDSSIAQKSDTLIPLRQVTDKLKAKIVWNGKSNKLVVQHGETNIELTIGESTALVNDESVTMSGNVFLFKGKVYVPQNFINEVFAIQTTWNKITDTVRVEEVSIETLAHQFVTSLQSGDFEGARLKFNSSLRPIVSTDSLKAQWLGQMSALGSLKKLKHTEVKKNALRDSVTLVYETEIAPMGYPVNEMQMTLQFDKNRKLDDFLLLNETVTVPSNYQLPAYAAPGSYTEKEVVIGASTDWPLPATLTAPKGQISYPVVVLAHGSGFGDRDESIGPDNKLFQDIATGLASQGIGVLSYDKRNLVYTQKFNASPATLKEEISDDTLAAVKWLRTQRAVEKNRIFVLGHSMGGTQLPKIINEDNKIAGAILLAGASTPLEDLHSNFKRYLEAGIIPQAFMDAFEHDLKLLQDPNYDPYTSQEPTHYFSPGLMKSFHNYRPAEVAKKQSTPYLLLQGGKDSNVPLSDFENWKNVLKDRSDVSFRQYDKLSHQFMEYDGEGYPSPADMLAPSHVPSYVINDIATWIKSSKK